MFYQLVEDRKDFNLRSKRALIAYIFENETPTRKQLFFFESVSFDTGCFRIISVSSLSIFKDCIYIISDTIFRRNISFIKAYIETCDISF